MNVNFIFDHFSLTLLPHCTAQKVIVADSETGMSVAHQGVDKPHCAGAVSGQVSGAVNVKREPGNRLGGNAALLRHRVGNASRAL